MGNNKGRQNYEFDLRTDLLVEAIKTTKKEQKLTQNNWEK